MQLSGELRVGECGPTISKTMAEMLSLLCRFLYEFPGELRLGEWSPLSSDMETMKSSFASGSQLGENMWTTEGSKVTALVAARGARNICMILIHVAHRPPEERATRDVTFGPLCTCIDSSCATISGHNKVRSNGTSLLQH
jgi:hypothetical protein